MMSGVILTSVRSRRRCLITSCPAACGIRCVKPSMATVSPSCTVAAIASASDTISATPPPALLARLYRNDIDNRTPSEHLCGLRSVAEQAGRDRERAVGRRHARVHRDLEQDLGYLLGRQAVPPRGPDVHGKFLLLAKDGKRGERDHAPLRAGEPWPGPDLAPRVPGDQVLERRGELSRASHRPVHVLVPEHLPAHPHPARRPFLIVHRVSLLVSSAPGPNPPGPPPGSGTYRGFRSSAS